MTRKELHLVGSSLRYSDLGGVGMSDPSTGVIGTSSGYVAADVVVTAAFVAADVVVTSAYIAADVVVTDAITTAIAGVADGQTFTGLVTGPMIQPTSTARTATADGLTTGTIAAGTSFVAVTSTDAAHIIILPATVVGTIIQGYVGSNGFELKPAASSGINGGVGSGFSSAIGANLWWEVVAVSSTQWLGSTMTVSGVKAAMAVSD